MNTLVVLGVASAACAVVAVLNAYQAATGRRLSNTPSRRDTATLRRDSLIAAVLLGLLAALGVAVLALDLCITAQPGI